MILLRLFLTFLQIGAVSFGGGYGMISLIREQCLAYGWLTEQELLNFIAVAESTPGPLVVNVATFVGSSQGGLAGALLATLGAVLPSFIIILIIAAVLKNLLKFAGVQAVLSGIRPAVTGLILATGITMFLTVIFSLNSLSGGAVFDWKGLAILALIVVPTILLKRFKRFSPSPIVLILFSAVLGMIFYSFF